MNSVMYFVFVLLYRTAPYFCVPRIVDLSHVQNEKTITYPINPTYKFTIVHRGQYYQLPWLELNAFQMPEHMGTHIDAPAIYEKGSWRLHQVPIERLYGPAVVINVKDKVAKDRDYRVLAEDMLAWEKKFGRIPKEAMVMMNSGWSSKYPNKTLVFGSDKHNEPGTFHFPSWHKDTAEWLVNNRDVNLVGVDTPSTDHGQSKSDPVHVLPSKEKIIMAEMVANLDKIPDSGSTMYVPALKIYDGSGGPARIFPTFDDNPQQNSAFIKKIHFVLLIRYFLMFLMLRF